MQQAGWLLDFSEKTRSDIESPWTPRGSLRLLLDPHSSSASRLSGKCRKIIYSKCIGDSGRMWHFLYLSADSRVGPTRPPNAVTTPARSLDLDAGKRPPAPHPWGNRVPQAALPGGMGVGDKVAQQESQKALPSQLPRHKKPDSSRGPDPFQIYIPLPARGPPLQFDLGLLCFLSGQPESSASFGAVWLVEPGFTVDFPSLPAFVILSGVWDRKHLAFRTPSFEGQCFLTAFPLLGFRAVELEDGWWVRLDRCIHRNLWSDGPVLHSPPHSGPKLGNQETQNLSELRRLVVVAGSWATFWHQLVTVLHQQINGCTSAVHTLAGTLAQEFRGS